MARISTRDEVEAVLRVLAVFFPREVGKVLQAASLIDQAKEDLSDVRGTIKDIRAAAKAGEGIELDAAAVAELRIALNRVASLPKKIEELF